MMHNNETQLHMGYSKHVTSREPVGKPVASHSRGAEAANTAPQREHTWVWNAERSGRGIHGIRRRMSLVPFGNQTWLAGKSPNWMEVDFAGKSPISMIHFPANYVWWNRRVNPRYFGVNRRVYPYGVDRMCFFFWMRLASTGTLSLHAQWNHTII